jgi:hypothetical protein
MQDERQQDIFEIATRALAEAKASKGGTGPKDGIQLIVDNTTKVSFIIS